MQNLKLFTSLAVGSLLISCFGTALFLGQTITGTITGSVSDQSGAAIPRVDLTATNTQTGVTYRAVGGENGIYRISLLPPGFYDLVAAKASFKKATVTGIEVKVDVVVGKDVTLEVGELSETVSVEANTNIVETESPSLGTVVQERQLTELPLIQRNFLKLATIAAGVMPQPTQNGEAPYARRPDYQIAVSGQRHTSTNTLFDGIPSKEFYIGANAAVPPVEAIAEFKVQHGYFAGSTDNAAVVNVVTKSGTNEIHGALWEFHQDQHLNARNFFSAGRPPSLQNKFGFAAGGPAIKNKLFWFGAYEGHRERVDSTGRGQVPETGWLSGDFSNLSTQLTDPLTGQPFPGNRIPSSRIDPFAKKFIDFGFIPVPNAPGQLFNFLGVTGLVRNDDTYLVRVDYAHSDSDKFFGRYSQTESLVSNRNLFTPLANGEFPLNSYNAVVDWVHIFSPTLTLNAKAGLNRVLGVGSAKRPPGPGGQLWTAAFGLKNLGESQSCDNAPGVTILGLSGFGAAADCENALQNDYHYLANIQWVRGRHHLSGGVEFRDKFQQLTIASSAEGRFGYNNAFSGNNVADFLLGLPSQLQGGTAGSPFYKNGLWFNGFVHDDFKFSRSLSFSFGMRYQVYPWLTEKYNRGAVFDTRGAGGFIFASPQDRRIVYTDKNDWAPRFGFAWAPGGREDFVLRSSFGIFYDEVPGNELAWDSLGPNASVIQTFTSDRTRPTLSMQNLFPKPPGKDPSQVRGISPILLSNRDRRDAYQQVWTLSLQKTIGWQTLLDVAYVGSRGLKLSKRRDINRPATGAPFSCDAACRKARMPYPDFGFILTDNADGHSYYDGLQINVRKGLTHGFSFLIGYTYSKALDTDSYDAKGARNGRPGDNDKARATFDLRQRFVNSLIYEVPKLESLGIGRHILGGWQVSGITTLQTGQPFHVTVGVDQSNTNAVFERRPNRIGNGNLPAGQRTPQSWIDKAAFVLSPEGTYGTSGAHFLDSDGYIGLDFAVAKNFPLSFISEQSKLQFRFEGFNAFNHANFNKPNANFSSTSFGIITAAQPSRTLQLGLKFVF